MKTINEIYNEMLDNSLNDYERVGWGSTRSQETRFSILTEIGDLNNKSILDVGCGLGSILQFINKKHSILSYTGIDINPNMIDEAKKKNPNAEFKMLDITRDLDQLNNRKFDYVFLSGAFNLNENNHSNNIKRVIKEIFELTNKGLALNFLSIFSDYLIPGEYYCNPSDILDYSFSLTKKVTLRHDYMPHDFTIYLYK